MPPALRSGLAIVAGVFAGSAVNMGIVIAGSRLVPPPPGTDVTTMEGLEAALPLLGPAHFVAPFLAHAVGTLVGAVVATTAARGPGRREAFVVGAFFLAGGLATALAIPAPRWFAVLDLLVAYLPAALLGHAIAARFRHATRPAR